jgi:large subunit ribosomal protein L1
MMPQIAKSLGQFLGPRNRMPKPLVGTDVAGFMNNISNSIYLRSKGKYLPTVHCIVGKEDMPVEKIAENVDQVVDAVARKVGKQNLKSVYLKLTMSKPMKIL